MKYIKVFENYNMESELKRYNIKNYTINSDGTIDVDDDIYLLGRKLTKLPFKFGVVSGNFDIRGNDLSSLEGCPDEIGGNFLCGYNRLTSLLHCPAEIGGCLNCGNNLLTKLDTTSNIEGNIYCFGNDIDEHSNGFMGYCGGEIFYEEFFAGD